ncbi:MAG: hypothetical protein R6W79_10830 [Acidimicrobiia bacterium]
MPKDLNKIGRKVGKTETPPPMAAKKKSSAKQTPLAKKSGKKNTKAAAGAEAAAVSSSPASVLEQVFDAVRRSRTGATIAKLKEKTNLDSRQLSNALYKLSKGGKIESVSRGVYIKKKS